MPSTVVTWDRRDRLVLFLYWSRYLYERLDFRNVISDD